MHIQICANEESKHLIELEMDVGTACTDKQPSKEIKHNVDK